jgi:hypothetical protein
MCFEYQGPPGYPWQHSKASTTQPDLPQYKQHPIEIIWNIDRIAGKSSAAREARVLAALKRSMPFSTQRRMLNRSFEKKKHTCR